MVLVAMATSQFFEVSGLFVFVSPLSNPGLEGFVPLYFFSVKASPGFL